MAKDLIGYEALADKAMRSIVKEALKQTEKRGLLGSHHFYLTFKTRDPGVEIPDFLLERYPEEMTIVLQNQFWDLKINETAFEVGLSFDDKPETLVIPFSAIKGFFDPSVQFGLELKSSAPLPTDDEKAEAKEPDKLAPPAAVAAEAPGEKVVSLDAFRKK